MLMVPQPERAFLLVVGKLSFWIHVSDLGNPLNPEERERADFILYELSAEHLFGSSYLQDLEIHKLRCDLVQVSGRRKEIPNRIQVGLDKLLLVEVIDFHVAAKVRKGGIGNNFVERNLWKKNLEPLRHTGYRSRFSV